MIWWNQLLLRGSYAKYPTDVKLKIAKHATENGVIAAITEKTLLLLSIVAPSKEYYTMLLMLTFP